ncbi:MAG: nicotinate-nucleotide adenylyltransferase [Flavobacteriaceae bacterium]|nr:nicotinate-nucleotide adenylyltransferase [Flavobacteriaceae bacterium]
MKKLIIGLFILGLMTQGFAQITKVEQLSEVVVVAVNYKYLNQVDSQEAAVPVELLQRKVATYDLKSQDFYDDDFEFYTVSFFIPEGKIVAAYDSNGKILRTIERYKDIALPMDVTMAVAKRFPGWSITKDVYLINYHESKGVNKKYKLTLENGDKRLKVKVDSEGNFM